MSLLPDPEELLAIADRIAGHAAAARSRADDLARALSCLRWRGAAADAFDGSADAVLGSLRSAAGRLDDAAATLRAHAHRVTGALAELLRGAAGLEAAGAAVGAAAGGALLRDAHTVVSAAGPVVGDALGLAGW